MAKNRLKIRRGRHTEEEAYLKLIGLSLKDFREQVDIQRYDLHKATKISQNVIIDIEEGTRNYTMTTFIRYLRACGLGISFTKIPQKKQ